VLVLLTVEEGEAGRKAKEHNWPAGGLLGNNFHRSHDFLGPASRSATVCPSDERVDRAGGRGGGPDGKKPRPPSSVMALLFPAGISLLVLVDVMAGRPRGDSFSSPASAQGPQRQCVDTIGTPKARLAWCCCIAAARPAVPPKMTSVLVPCTTHLDSLACSTTTSAQLFLRLKQIHCSPPRVQYSELHTPSVEIHVHAWPPLC
jgi:hypothetical protein